MVESKIKAELDVLSSFIVLIDRPEGVDEIDYLTAMRREGVGMDRALTVVKVLARAKAVERFPDPSNPLAHRFRLKL